MKTGIKTFGRTTKKNKMAERNAPPSEPRGGSEYAIAKLTANTIPEIQKAAVAASGRAKYKGNPRYRSRKLIQSLQSLIQSRMHLGMAAHIHDCRNIEIARAPWKGAGRLRVKGESPARELLKGDFTSQISIAFEFVRIWANRKMQPGFNTN
jgi:hypothetical protein